MRKCFLILSLTFCCSLNHTFALTHDKGPFQKIFTRWTEAFNHKNLAGSCALFSTSVIATYRGIPVRHYDDICQGFKKIFANQTLDYRYRFKIHDVYSSHDLAAVRVSWFLSIFRDNKEIETSHDEGLDVFAKEKDGKWRIVNYLSYAV